MKTVILSFASGFFKRCKLLLLVLCFLLLSTSSQSHATSCFYGRTDPLTNYPIIFRGRVTQLTPFAKEGRAWTAATFKVNEKYKGIVDDSVVVFHADTTYPNPSLIVWHEYLVFVDTDFIIHDCGRTVDLTAVWFRNFIDPIVKLLKRRYGNEVPSSVAGIVKRYVEYKEKIDTFEERARKLKTDAAYLELGEFFEKHHDFMRAEKTYYDLVKIQKWDTFAFDSMQKECKLASPDSRAQNKDTEALLRLGRAFLGQDKYAEALGPLCMASQLGNSHAENMRTFALIALGRKSEVSPGPHDLSNVSVANTDGLSYSGFVSFDGHLVNMLDFSDMDLRGWNLSNLNPSGVFARNTDMSTVVFNASPLPENKEIRGISLDLADVNLALSVLNNLALDLKLENVDFTGADLQNTVLMFEKAKGVKFDKANLSGARFYPGTRMEEVSLLDATLKNASLQSIDFSDISFGRADLTGADFSKMPGKEPTNFSGADLSKANIEGAKFDEAVYDCYTKFPKGFAPETVMRKLDVPGCGSQISP